MNNKQNPEKHLPSKTDIEQFEMLYPMLLADLAEIKELSKKKQDGVLNQVKVKIINKKLEQIKGILSNEPTSEFIELLDEDTLPTNSDAVLMITQFKSALEQFESKYFTRDEIGFNKSWKTRD